MKRFTAGLSILAALALVPATAVAEEPSSTDKANASKQCKAQKAGMGEEAFKQLYGTNESRSNAHGKCVSKFAKDEQQERKAAKSNAAKDCKAEQEADPAAFKTTYGTGKSGNNAYGRCVSQKAKANKEAADEADAENDKTTINSAKQCRAEQKADKDAFAAKYGTKRNAFGKCVSQKSREKNDEETTS